MSTPSTATAALPPHLNPYGYSQRPGYSAQYGAHGELAAGAPSRLAHPSCTAPTRNSGATSRAAAPPAVSSPSQSSPRMADSRSHRRPDWNEFYKNGPPKEIIVIDDSPPPQRATSRTNLAVQNLQSVATEPASKKRRVNQAHEAAPATQQASYSHPTTPHNAGSETISTDRTTSLNTTAPTSLGSNGGGSYVDGTAVGQKRKRVTRQQAADEKKRQEQEAPKDTYSSYVPPAKPYKQLEDVKVRLVRDFATYQHKIDDDKGHFIVIEHADIADRYQIRRLLGQGTFGKVVEAYDKVKGTYCAIKIIRSVQKYRDASRIELRVLATLARNDDGNRNRCIHLRDCFDFRNHICIVTDLYGQSVFDFLEANTFVPFPSSQIQSFARQLLTSVAFLHDLNLIHTDLKPENILLVNNAYQTFTYNRNIPSSSTTVQRTARQRRVLLDTEIRLIDFGSATFNDEYHSSVVSTRHYRAPEIILNLGWSYPCDIWSVGCILVEFFTGDALFQTHDNLEHLAMMESVCGTKIDAKIVRAVQQNGRGNANVAAKFFKGLKLDYPGKETTRASRKYVSAMKQLQDIIPPTNSFNKQFLDLLRGIFVYDPSKRIKAHEALNHPWFNESLIDDGTEAARLKREHDEQIRLTQGARKTNNGYR